MQSILLSIASHKALVRKGFLGQYFWREMVASFDKHILKPRNKENVYQSKKNAFSQLTTGIHSAKRIFLIFRVKLWEHKT